MQADAAELYLRSNCPLKMSFQGHETMSPAKPSIRLQRTSKPTVWQICHNFQ
jgi:hypothetical protein